MSFVLLSSLCIACNKGEAANAEHSSLYVADAPELRPIGVTDLPDTSGVPRVTIHGATYWLFQGDILLSDEEAFRYLGAPTRTGPVEPRLIVERRHDAIGNAYCVKWPYPTTLTFCVLESSFKSDDHYRDIIGRMGDATKAWQHECGIKFEYLSQYDTLNLEGEKSAVPKDLVFVVRECDSNKFLAAGFPPDASDKRRVLEISRRAYLSELDLTGILRHEVGHILGFRHNHVLDLHESLCAPREPGSFEALTPDDPKSVMHYFCPDGSVGDPQMQLSEIDKKGAAEFYPRHGW
jgi:hypothetical protein